MPIAKAVPIHFTPTGLCDAADSTYVFKGACSALINLIFDHSNQGCVISRPGVGLPLVTQAQFNAGLF